MMQNQAHGIYLNKASNKVKRIGIGVHPPEGADWVKVTDDPNATIISIRETVKEKSLSAKADEVAWDF